MKPTELIIPLSIEILENSGFLYGISYYSENVQENFENLDIDGHYIEFPKKSWSYIDSMEEVSIYFPDKNNRGRVSVSNKNKNINLEYVFNDVIYVHQLQQIMQLCEIKIDLNVK